MQSTKNLNDKQALLVVKQALKHRTYKSDHDLANDMQLTDKFDLNAYEQALNNSNVACTNQTTISRNLADYYEEIHSTFEEDVNDSRFIRRVIIYKKRNKGSPVTLKQLSAQIAQLTNHVMTNCATKADIQMLETKINNVDAKVDNLTVRVDNIDTRLTKLENDFKVFKNDFEMLKVENNLK